MYQLTEKEKKTINKIEKTYYMKPAIDLINQIISDKYDQTNLPNRWKSMFNRLYEILIKTKKDVDILLLERRNNGKIKSISQARKSIAGNAFSNLVVYVFLKNKEYEVIRNDIFITSRLSEIKDFDKISTIKVGSETQKPDVDLVIYTKENNNSIKNCVILSLKTSLRERAGQTYKWKLLMEIATTDNPIKDKYEIQYNPDRMPSICFATVNFYNEINNPQHRGMFKFFDNSFIGKPVNSNFINPMSDLVDYVNEIL